MLIDILNVMGGTSHESAVHPLSMKSYSIYFLEYIREACALCSRSLELVWLHEIVVNR